MNPKFSIEETGPRIEKFLSGIIASAGFDLSFRVAKGDADSSEIETPDIEVKFEGADVDLLLSNRAELLLALELVTQEALRLHSDEHSRISFDANDYRALRMEELRLSAIAAAESVKRRGTPFRFGPMNSRERRIIHIALRDETTLRSESAGAGPHRHVVVYPAGMPSLPDPPPPAYAPRGGGNRFGGRGNERGGSDRGRSGDRGHGGPRGPRRDGGRDGHSGGRGPRGPR